MKNNNLKIWSFISENVVALSTVIAGVAILIWQSVTNFQNIDPFSAAILGLLCLLATSEMVEGRKRLEKIQETLDKEISRIAPMLSGVSVKRFSDSESGLNYLCEKINNASVSIDYASIDSQSRTSAGKMLGKLSESQVNVISKGEVRFRYLFQSREGRTKGIQSLLKVAKATGKFFSASLPHNKDEFPILSFVIFDNVELFTRSPYNLGDDEIYLSIQHPDIVSLFLQWYNQLWNIATKIDPRLPYEKQMEIVNNLATPDSNIK